MNYRLMLIALLLALFTVDCSAQFLEGKNPPKAKRIPHITKIHGRELVDSYFWLRQKENPQVLDYLKAENAYTKRMMSSTKKLQKTLYGEMVARIKESDLSVPEVLGDYFYFSRTEKGKEYKYHFRKKGSLQAKEELILDENLLAKGREYFSLGAFEVCPQQRLLAIACDFNGSERYVISIKDLSTGEFLKDEIKNVCCDIAWAKDGRTFFYTVPNGAERPHRVYRHRIGTKTSSDVLVFEDVDEAFSVGVSRTKDWAWIVITSGSSTSSESWYLDGNTPNDKFKLFAKRRKNVEYSIYHHGNDVFVLTNDGAVNFKVYRTSDDAPSRKNWTVFIPHRPKVKVDGLDVFKSHLVVYERENALRTIRYFDFKSKGFKGIDFPEPVYTFYRHSNEEYDTSLLRYTYTSFTTPDSVYDFDMNTGKSMLKKRKEVKGGFRPEDYISERLWATSHDGVKVPLSIMYRRGRLHEEGNDVYMTGYGAYGDPYDPYFSSNRLSIVDRGFIYAIAQIRGGEDQGRPWYYDGKLLKKRNTFLDFIACGEHLVKIGYSKKGRIAIQGGSAGGLLMGAVTNMRKDLWGAVVADVPFVDAINTMLDPSIPLVVGEYDEWGNPRVPKYFDYIMSYSPYDNVVREVYPPMLITAGLNDPRVQYWEPTKWAAKLRYMKKGNNVLLLKTNMGAGHGGASGRYSALEELSFEYAFILKALGHLR